MLRKTLLIVSFALATLSAAAKSHIDSLLNVLHNPKSDYVFVIAHRADWRGAPENSIQGIENAIRMGVDMVEIDIQRTRDGHFIVMHDRTLNRTSTGKGAIADYDLSQLAQFRLKSGNGIKSRRTIPTLEDVLNTCRDRVLVNIDKGGEYIAEILPIIRRLGVERQVVIKGKYTVDKVRSDYGQNTDMLYMPIVDMYDSTAVAGGREFIEKFHPVAFELNFRTDEQLDKKFVNSIVKSGSRVWINTLWDTLCAGHDDENALIEGKDRHWGWVLKHKATMIQTDRPEMLIQYLKAKGRRNLK